MTMAIFMTWDFRAERNDKLESISDTLNKVVVRWRFLIIEALRVEKPKGLKEFLFHFSAFLTLNSYLASCVPLSSFRRLIFVQLHFTLVAFFLGALFFYVWCQSYSTTNSFSVLHESRAAAAAERKRLRRGPNVKT